MGRWGAEGVLLGGIMTCRPGCVQRVRFFPVQKTHKNAFEALTKLKKNWSEGKRGE